MFANNHCEVFNSKIVKARPLPIIGCLEGIRKYCLTRIVARRDLMLKLNAFVVP